MELPWILLTGALVLAILCLLLYPLVLRRSIREAAEELEEKLRTDTNTLISISAGDRAIRMLASQINRQLQALRRERLKLQTGSDELTTAVTHISHDLRTPLTAICGYLDLRSAGAAVRKGGALSCRDPRADGRHAQPDGGAVPLLRHHRHGGGAAQGDRLPERCAGAEPRRVLRRAVRRSEGRPYRCWISTILNNTTGSMLGRPLSSQ